MDCQRFSKILLLTLSLFFLPLQGLEIITEKGALVSPAREIVKMYEIEGDLPSIVQKVGETFIQADKERWEFESQFAPDSEALCTFFQELGCIEGLRASATYYDYALVLGALGSRMESRVNHLFEELQRGTSFGAIVLLSGARDLNPALEEIPDGLASEMELLHHLIMHHPLLPLLGDTPIIAVDAPKEPTRCRPTTASTAFEWLRQNPEPGSCLAISNQPYVGYQEAVLRSMLPGSFQIEGVGPAVEKMPPLSILLDNFAKWLHFATLGDH